MKAKEKKTRTPVSRIFKNVFYALGILWHSSPAFLLVKFSTDTLRCVTIMLEHTFLVAYIISCYERGAQFYEVLWFFVPLTSLIVMRMFLEPWLNSCYYPRVIEKIKLEINLTLYRKAASMDIASYDDPCFYNDFVWAMRDAPSHVFSCADTISSLFSSVVNLVIGGAFMISIDARGLIFVVATCVISVLMNLKINRLSISMKEEMRPAERRRDYINRVFYLQDYVRDLKMSDMSEKLYEDFDRASDEMTETVKKRSPRIVVLEAVSSCISSILSFDGFYLTFLLYQALEAHVIGYGELVALYNVSYRLRGNLSSITMYLPQFQQHSLYIDKMRTFLEHENTLRDDGLLPVPPCGEICLRDVRFRYPEADADTLHGINLTIKQGEKIALVGYNGAGKSTLIKLLLRLYDPDSGTITYGGTLLAEYPLADYRKHCAAVFQSYELMATTLGENITMSTEPTDDEKCRRIFADVDFSECFERLPHGLDTPVTKEFDADGAGFSGGEAQKIAISRVLYSDATLLILDEPSSALDPDSEYKLNHTILGLSEDKTVIIISHRLSTARSVDKIYMMENGEIIESGTHDALMERGGKYARMFELQAKKYRSEAAE